MTAEEIQRLITSKLNCELCDVQGDGRHWFATIVSSEFEGLRMVARHQKVYETVKVEMKNDTIHALSLQKTITPLEYASK